MTIQIGDTIPSVILKRLGAGGMEDVNTDAALKGKKVVLFGVPGAFTPSCSLKHLPGYVANAAAIKAKGVDEIICVAANDPFVMKQWGQDVDPEGKITLWPDGNRVLRDAMGLVLDAAGAGLGKRFQRFSMVVEDGKVTSLEVEPVASDVELSGADACLSKLG